MELYSGDDLWLPGETALARNSCNATESAYAQSDLFERLRPLMEEWSGFLSGDEGKPVLATVGTTSWQCSPLSIPSCQPP